MDLDNVFYSIRRYAKRNQVMHSMVGVYIKNCDFNPLAMQLSRDIKDVRHIFGDTEYKNMMQVLHATRDRYFTGIDNPLLLIT